MANQRDQIRKKDRRAGLPPIPADVTPAQRQFFQAVLDNLSVRLGQSGSRDDTAVTFRELEDRLSQIRQLIDQADASGGGGGGGGSGDDTAGFLDGLSEGSGLSENDLVLRSTGTGYNWGSFPALSGGGGGDVLVDGGAAASDFTQTVNDVDGGSASG